MGNFLMALVGKLCADEVKAWLPVIAEFITKVAVRSLAQEHRARYNEEWRSHLNDVAGPLAKVLVSCGFLSAALQLPSRMSGILLYACLSPLVFVVRTVFHLSQRETYTFPMTLMKDRVENFPKTLVDLMTDEGYAVNQVVRLEAIVTTREIPLARMLHESLPSSFRLSPIYNRNSHYAFWRPPLIARMADYFEEKRLNYYARLLNKVVSGGLSPREWLTIVLQGRENEISVPLNIDLAAEDDSRQ